MFTKYQGSPVGGSAEAMQWQIPIRNASVKGHLCAGNSVDSGPFYLAINTAQHGPNPMGPEEGGKGDRENYPAAPARIFPSHYLSVLAIAILE